MEIASWPRAIRKIGLPLSVLAILALAGCSGFDGPSPFMDVYWEKFDARACRHVLYPPTPRQVDDAEMDACVEDWMRNRVEGALLKRFPLGSDVRDLVRYLEIEDFTCIKFDKSSSSYNAANYKCHFDSIEQNYGPIFIFELPWYPFEMKWTIDIYYYDEKILWLESWHEMRDEGER